MVILGSRCGLAVRVLGCVLLHFLVACSTSVELLPSPEPSAGGGAAGSGGASPEVAPSCPVPRFGSPMVLIPGADDWHYCMDGVETTNAMYASYLATDPTPNAADWPSECEAEGLGLAPAEGWPPAPSAGDIPVGSITWCQAYAYCQADGKRLCGRMGGGEIDLGELNAQGKSLIESPELSEWGFACTAGGKQPYPYGDELDQGRCNADAGTWTPDTPPHVLSPNEDFLLCEGGFPGLFQLTGNVLEWEDACSRVNTDLDSPFCIVRGRYLNGSGCHSTSYAGPDHDTFVGGFDAATGIRCCADAIYLPSEGP